MATAAPKPPRIPTIRISHDRAETGKNLGYLAETRRHLGGRGI